MLTTMPPDRPYKTPTGGFFRSAEAEALWRAREEDNARVSQRFDRIDERFDDMDSKLTVLSTDVKGIQAAEQQKADSVEKRNNRLWQIGGPIMVALTAALIIGLFKVFLPLAAAGAQSRPPTVNEQLDEFHRGDSH